MGNPAHTIGENRPTPLPPVDTRVYAIGDIHGHLSLLEQIHELILEDSTRATALRNVVVYLGDYVDRGPDSAGVIDCLLAEPLGDFEYVYLNPDFPDEGTKVRPGVRFMYKFQYVEAVMGDLRWRTRRVKRSQGLSGSVSTGG